MTGQGWGDGGCAGVLWSLRGERLKLAMRMIVVDTEREARRRKRTGQDVFQVLMLCCSSWSDRSGTISLCCRCILSRDRKSVV